MRTSDTYRAAKRNATRCLVSKALKAERKKIGETRREQDRRRYFERTQHGS